MGYLKRLELENFKSYKGLQVIGPFKRFTAIIGPNGAGKSNLMDAISFVLGERTQHLRVRQLKDLIHGAPIGKPVASRAKVTAVYGEGDEDIGGDIQFTRIIIGSGTEYRINGKVVTPASYQARLESLGILIKAKNFLVFQGAVESIAMKTPKERTQLFEEISRSGELAKDYEKKKEAMLKANELTNFSYHKRKGMTLEKKEARAEKEEAEKYQKFQQELVDAQVQEQLFKLYHNERDIERLSDELKGRQKDLDRLNNRRGKIEAQLKSKKQEAAKWSREVGLLEKKVREQEVEMSKRKPLYIKAKEKTSHVLKRLEASKRAHKRAQEVHKKHQEEVSNLERELEDTRERAALFYQEIEEQSQGQDMQLLDSQITYLVSPGNTKSNPASCCMEILDLFPDSPSGFYWIKTHYGAKQMYCDMERSCNGVDGGWMRVASINMTDGNDTCPPGLNTIVEDSRILCSRNTDSGCSSTVFPLEGVQYSRVCGKIIGYQQKSPDAFYRFIPDQNTVDSNYVDGISLTHGSSPREHIWTFAAALQEDISTQPVQKFLCPCTNINNPGPTAAPSFIGHDYFCDTGNPDFFQFIFYGDDPLWDGAGCGGLNTCCSLNSPPWFLKEMSTPTYDDIEMRLCADQPIYDEDITFETLELYVQ